MGQGSECCPQLNNPLKASCSLSQAILHICYSSLWEHCCFDECNSGSIFKSLFHSAFWWTRLSVLKGTKVPLTSYFFLFKLKNLTFKANLVSCKIGKIGQCKIGSRLWILAGVTGFLENLENQWQSTPCDATSHSNFHVPSEHACYAVFRQN